MMSMCVTIACVANIVMIDTTVMVVFGVSDVIVVIIDVLSM